MSQGGIWAFDGSGPAQLVVRLRAVSPALLFGMRLWAAVSLALCLAFWLQLDNPAWAGTSAAVVCQPGVGASLRKGWFRVIGTIIGAVAIVVLTAWFPQQRTGFLLGLALWCAAAGLLATLLRNFASYAAALAGYTAAIIAADELGATGGTSPDVFLLAVSRATEIGIGIVCAGAVLAATDFGGARRRLATQLAALSAEIAARLAATFALTGPALADLRPVRRDLVRKVVALDPVIEEAIGESSDLRVHSAGLRTALDGLFAALAGWRMVAAHLEAAPGAAAGGEAGLVLDNIPAELRSAPNRAAGWAHDPSGARAACAAAARALAALPGRTPSLRLLADQTARALIGIARALDGVALLADPGRRIPVTRPARFQVADWLPALVSAARAFVTIAALELLWIVTEWPNGTGAITFAAVILLLFSPRADEAYAIAMKFMAGIVVATAVAGLIKFAVLPGVTSFPGLSLAIGLVLVPAGAMVVLPWQPGLFLAVTVGLIPLLGPTNQMTYDTAQFYNAALAILAGVGAATLSFRLLPPPSPALRTRRLLAFTLRDLRRLATSPTTATRAAQDWEDRAYGRLAALPGQAEPLQRAELVAALAVGREIIRLRRAARRLMADSELDAALAALARGDSAAAGERLARLDARLAALPGAVTGAQLRLRARGSILAVMEALTQHAAYFDAEAAR
jgi:uncharacterized membrane protein YccC